VRSLEVVIERAIWDVDMGTLPIWRAWLTRLLRILHAVANDLREGQLTLRAMSLVYTTLLSLVPLLAVSFSVLKGFGVHNQIEPMLLGFLAPLGEKGLEITTNIIGFVDNMQVGVLGALGLGMLFFTVISLIQKIEGAFNYAWHTTAVRSLGQRFSNYLSVIMVGPLLMFSALGITASISSSTLVQRVASIQGIGSVLDVTGQLIPYLLVITAFAFVYVFVPNTKVGTRPAIVGAVIAATLWETAAWVFASFVASSAKYTAIYSGFAILLFFMIWLYVSWLILLLGADIAFYVQHPEHLRAHRGDLTLSNRMKEKLALLIMARIGRDHLEGHEPRSLDDLARWLATPMDVIGVVLKPLENRGLVARTAEEGYLPARAVDTVFVKEILDAVRSAEESPHLSSERLPCESGVESALGEIDRALSDSFGQTTLRQLADPASRSVQ
jgi:membrane protein